MSKTKNRSKFSIIITCLCLLIALLTIVLPTLYVDVKSRVIMGWTTSFSIPLHNWNQRDVAELGFNVGGFITFILPLVGASLAFFFGTNQKSTYFFTLCLFIAQCVLYFFQRSFFLNVNVAGGYDGMESAVLCAGPYVCLALSIIGCILSLVAIFYRPNKRLARKY